MWMMQMKGGQSIAMLEKFDIVSCVPEILVWQIKED